MEGPLKNELRFQRCPTGSPDMLNVHIVSHSHDDVGWLKTVDQYYYGGEKLAFNNRNESSRFMSWPELCRDGCHAARSEIKNVAVQYIIDSYLDELLKDPSRR
jgi:lysosomal alpha-mannosidase